jgi:serine/threonine-protein kinase
MKVCPACKTRFEDDLSFCTVDGEVLEDDPTTLVNATLDGQYHIESLLGKGGMGAVYRARHILLGDRVAIKVLPPEMRSNAEWLRRFKREGQAARRFRHPNAVTVYDLRTTNDGMIYMVMEYVEGRTLDAELRSRGRFSAADALAVLEPVMSVLNAAHEQGVVHRDLKPENIMIGKPSTGGATPTIKLLDLGIAKLSELAGAPKTETNVPLTVVGQILGTPYYMSPEQWGEVPRDHNSEIDGRADIYSLGVVFYELVSGRRPFNGMSLAEIRREHVSGTAPALSQVMPEVPAGFGAAIAEAMSKDRSDRPSTAGELANRLRQSLGMPVLSASAFSISSPTHDASAPGVASSSDPSISTLVRPEDGPAVPTNYGAGVPTNYPGGSGSEATMVLHDPTGVLPQARDTGAGLPVLPANPAESSPLAATSLAQMPPAAPPPPATMLSSPNVSRPAPQATMVSSSPQAQAAPPAARPAYAPPAYDAPAKKKGKAGVFLGVGGVVIVLAVIVLAVGGFLGYKYWWATPENKEAYRYYLETTEDSNQTSGARNASGLPTLKSKQSFRIHLIPKVNGFLYILGPGPSGRPSTYLTNQPVPDTHVPNNELAANQEYIFPREIWITLDTSTGTDHYILIISPKKLDSPAFLADTAAKDLTEAQNAELKAFIDKYSANKPEPIVINESGGDGFVTINTPPGANADDPIIYDLKVQHQ